NRGAFIVRGSAGKTEMDFAEVRAAFLGSETITSKLDDFRQDRIGRLIAGESIVPIIGAPMLVIEILPAQSFTPGFRCDLTRISKELTSQNLLIPRKAIWGWQARFTHYGFVQTCTMGRASGQSEIYAN